MTTMQPNDIVNYLSLLPSVLSVEPCRVTIKGISYNAARYKELLPVSEGTQAYRRGEREYMRETIYIVGALPAVKRNGNCVFRLAGDPHDWYVAGYYPAYKNRQPQPAGQPNQYHPFGAMFLLSPWDVKDSTIDQYERHPYKRVAIIIDKL